VALSNKDLSLKKLRGIEFGENSHCSFIMLLLSFLLSENLQLQYEHVYFT